MRRAGVLFWGRALAVQQTDGERVYTVEIWGGNHALPVTVSVRTARHSASCGIELPLNEAEIIAGSVKDNAVYANLCMQYWVKTHRAQIVEHLKKCTPFRPCPDP